MQKIYNILELLYWLFLTFLVWGWLLIWTIQLGLQPLYRAALNWLEFGIWEIDTFASVYGLVPTSSWVGVNKLISFVGGIATWWPSLIAIGYGFVITIGLPGSLLDSFSKVFGTSQKRQDEE